MSDTSRDYPTSTGVWWVVAVITLFVVRPVCGWLSLAGSPLPRPEKTIISVFGIRGIGSIYYLTYATGKARFEGVETVTLVMRWIDKTRGVDSLRPLQSDTS